MQGFILMGHSTGTQDTVRYVQRYYGDPEAPPLLAVILQAPVRLGLNILKNILKARPAAIPCCA